MFLVDGEPDALPAHLFSHFDYLVLQTYTTHFIQDNSRLDTRFEKQYQHFKEEAVVDEIARKLLFVRILKIGPKPVGRIFICRTEPPSIRYLALRCGIRH